MDSDSEDNDIELPSDWREAICEKSNKVFYVNVTTNSKLWFHPLTKRRYKAAPGMPDGWTRQTSASGKTLFMNERTHQSTDLDPRLASKYEVDDNNRPTMARDLNSSSTTEDVLANVDLAGRVAIVTGANSGIGFETARAFALKNAHVVLACRNRSSASETIASITREFPDARLTFLHCDLTSLESVRQFCKEFLALSLDLHILVLNAAINGLPYTLTGDGFETTFQVNHLAHFYMVKLLTNRLKESAPSRVVIVSSESHRQSTITEKNIREQWTEKNFISFFAYNDSKLFNILLANELHRRLSRHNVAVVSCHPGNLVFTALQRHWWLLRLLYILAKPFTKTPNQGAATVVYCSVAPEIAILGASQYYNNCRECPQSSTAANEHLAKLLWDYSDELLEQGCWV